MLYLAAGACCLHGSEAEHVECMCAPAADACHTCFPLASEWQQGIAVEDYSHKKAAMFHASGCLPGPGCFCNAHATQVSLETRPLLKAAVHCAWVPAAPAGICKCLANLCTPVHPSAIAPSTVLLIVQCAILVPLPHAIHALMDAKQLQTCSLAMI